MCKEILVMWRIDEAFNRFGRNKGCKLAWAIARVA